MESKKHYTAFVFLEKIDNSTDIGKTESSTHAHKNTHTHTHTHTHQALMEDSQHPEVLMVQHDVTLSQQVAAQVVSESDRLLGIH